jgi:hypothetical protein
MASLADAPYLPFVDRARRDDSFRWRLGVRPLDLHDWIERGPDADAIIADKARLRMRFPETVFAVSDDIESESSEVANAIVGHLRWRWPDQYGDATLDSDLHPLDAAARLVPEDLVLMVERDGKLIFGGGSVCSPNRWDLRSKLGLTLAEVHAPVAQLNAQLEAPIDLFFDRLTPDRSFWRLGWGVIDSPALYAPIDGTEVSRPENPSAGQHVLRVERETLRRFPATNCVLFTIRTYVTSLEEVAQDPEVSSCLADAVAALPDDVLVYKDLQSTGAAIIERLRRNPPEPDTL